MIEAEIVCNGTVHYRRPFNDPMVRQALDTPGYSIQITASLKEIARDLKAGGMKCNCDLDTWEPEPESGHSHVCRIHKKAWTMKYQPWDIKEQPK